MTLVSFFLYEASFDGEALTPLKVEAGGRPLSCANRFSLPRAACATGTDLPQGRPELLWLPGRQAGRRCRLSVGTPSVPPLLTENSHRFFFLHLVFLANYFVALPLLHATSLSP